MTALRVVVVDDHPVFRGGLRTLFSTDPGVELVGEADSGEQAMSVVVELHPDVVLLDLQMPGMGGLEACRRLVAERPDLRVVVLTMAEDDGTLVAAVRAGACGYLLKGADGEEVLAAVRTAARGGAVFGERAAAGALAAMHGPVVDDRFPQLSERELQVLRLLGRGLTNGAVARELGLSVKTVQNYVSAVLTTLGVPDRTAAALLAREAGLTG